MDMKSKGTGNIAFPNATSSNGGNLPTCNVGKPPGPMGSAGGIMKNGGSYTMGAKPGTVKAK
jgi:hypothetical protein